ncbi:MAG: gluconeogenesis factor YvcK family protein [Patescibacteria group bacterium]
MQQKKIVVIGGGTGSFVLLSGLKNYPVDLTAIVPVTDDGGSTGRLRDEFGFLPVGDIRQCLAALAKENGLFQKLFTYRFEKGKGIKGHSLGNLFLTALEDILGSEPAAVEQISKLFRLKGTILPISRQMVKLAAEYSDGQTIISEHKIEVHRLKKNERIVKLYTLPQALINPQAKVAIETAELVIFAPGDLFNSLIASLVVKGSRSALQRSQAKLVYIVNLMTLNSQTNYFTALDHIKELEKYSGRKIDSIIVNNQPIPPVILQAYKTQTEYSVEDNLGEDSRVIRQPLLANTPYQKPTSDSLKRSLLRHDSAKLARTIIKLINR